MPYRIPCSYCQPYSGLFSGTREVDLGLIASARFRVGSNGDGTVDQIPDNWGYGLGHDVQQPPAHAGLLTWDPTHEAANDRFSSVAQVLLEVTQSRTRFSVGTNKFLVDNQGIPADAFVDRVRIVADLGANPPRACFIQWDHIDLFLLEPDGNCEQLTSPALPLASKLPVIQDFNLPFGQPPPLTRQEAHFHFQNKDVKQLLLRGQVTLRANHVYGQEDDLGLDHLTGSILVYRRA